MVQTQEQDLKAWVKAVGKRAGADAIGVARVSDYARLVPSRQVPDNVGEGMQTLVVFVKHMLTGAFALNDVDTQSLNSHVALDACNEIGFQVCDWLEEKGHIAIPINPEYSDAELNAIGGLLDLKYAAEFAGLGHVGLNLNFLTPEFGPRVYIGALLTDAVMEPDAPLAEPLCPGMSCGRCATVCPTKAIPCSAPRDQHVDQYKTLDKDGCARCATILSPRSFFGLLGGVLRSRTENTAEQWAHHHYFKLFWSATLTKRGAFAACFECWYVCPVGARDSRAIFRVPYRQQDIPGRKVEHVKTEAVHEIIFKGPPTDRVNEYALTSSFSEL